MPSGDDLPALSPLGPFRTRPIFKPKVWAGDRLADLVADTPDGTGEVWLVSDVPENASVIRDGPAAGQTLRDLVRERPEELLGPELTAQGETQFPLLIKLLDIATPLSVQLHPDAAAARALGDGERGKCEAWLVIAPGPQARIYLGVEPGVSPPEVTRLAESGELADRLATFEPASGEGLEILPGTLHTARDVLVLEVQETSDITYRVFDWGRGRELHLEQAERVLELLGPQPAPPRDPNSVGWSAGPPTEVAPHCPFTFTAVQLEAHQSWSLPQQQHPSVLVVLEGCGRLTSGVELLDLVPGDSVVCPALITGAELDALERMRFGYAATYVG